MGIEAYEIIVNLAMLAQADNKEEIPLPIIVLSNGNPPFIRVFPPQRVINAEGVSMSPYHFGWVHSEIRYC